VLHLVDDLPPDPQGIHEGLSALPWELLLPERVPWAVRAVGTSRELRHTGFTARAAKDALVDRFESQGRAAPPVDPRDARIVVDVRVTNRTLSAGLDLGGALHKRESGRYGEAPLREDVAAGLALLAGAADGVRALVDPFCGTGTLIGEAAGLALGLPPHRVPRRMPLGVLPLFAELDLEEIARECISMPGEPVWIAGRDRDPRALQMARVALDRQGLAEHIRLSKSEVQELRVPEGLDSGLLLGNPPWGQRLEEGAAESWRALGTRARECLGGWTLALLSGNPELTRELGFRASRRFPVMVGGIDCRWLLYQVRARR
jgi:23S rRNA G2445 N2-methylase RlmL